MLSGWEGWHYSGQPYQTTVTKSWAFESLFKKKKNLYQTKTFIQKEHLKNPPLPK